jgi:hypothetical protein
MSTPTSPLGFMKTPPFDLEMPGDLIKSVTRGWVINAVLNFTNMGGVRPFSTDGVKRAIAIGAADLTYNELISPSVNWVMASDPATTFGGYKYSN